MAAPCWLPLFWLRVGAGYLTRGGCGELADRALHPIALTTAAHRGHLVVIGRLRLQTVYPHTENRLLVARSSGRCQSETAARRAEPLTGSGPRRQCLPG